MKTAHTPGPWRIKKVGSTYLIGVNGSMGFSTNAEVDIIGHGKERMEFYQKQSEADAKLIAAAPELLEAFVRLIDRIEEQNLENRFPSAYQRALDAIKKATE